MTEKQTKFLKIVRQALLLIVDGIEELLEMPERTADLRKRVKELAYLESCQLKEI